MRGLAFPLALLGGLLVAGAALGLRVLHGDANRPVSEAVPLLFVAAGLCVGALMRRRSPSLAWLATAGVGALAALEILGAVRAWLPNADAGTAPWLVLVAELALLVAALIAGAYAGRARAQEGMPSAAWRLLVIAGIGLVAMATGWVTFEAFSTAAAPLTSGPATGDLPPIRISARIAAGFVAVMIVAGALLDVAGPVRRARSRTAGLRGLPSAVIEELVPSAAAARRRGRDDERARLAADLHALVLPDLRRAAQAAEAAEESGAPPNPAAADLRQMVEGVEQLMHERQSVVLEQFGLVAALEWLAERTQERARIDVEIELDGADVNDAGAVSPSVGRAAFRVALLALDNVVRHADATRAVVRLTTAGGRGRLAVVDDGRGLDDAPSNRGGRAGRGGRGLIDMRAAAAEVGGALRVERREGATAVEMTWGDPTATGGALRDLADQPAETPWAV